MTQYAETFNVDLTTIAGIPDFGFDQQLNRIIHSYNAKGYKVESISYLWNGTRSVLTTFIVTKED